jgi:hypothetical protein
MHFDFFPYKGLRTVPWCSPLQGSGPLSANEIEHFPCPNGLPVFQYRSHGDITNSKELRLLFFHGTSFYNFGEKGGVKL